MDYKVLVLGATGFVGRHIITALGAISGISVITAGRSTHSDYHLDLMAVDGVDISGFDLIINAAGYGVVKTETELDVMTQVNYLGPAALYSQLSSPTRWLQIGTAFEYDLSLSALTEETRCVPKTHYGISKWMMSHFLMTQQLPHHYCIVRPFAMFGPYEADSKIIPYLIQAQRHKETVKLSSGIQSRDYVYVRDVAEWLARLCMRWLRNESLPPIINVGSGIPRTLRLISESLAEAIPDFDSRYWGWGEIPSRSGESDLFYNASVLAKALGFQMTSEDIAFKDTVNFYG